MLIRLRNSYHVFILLGLVQLSLMTQSFAKTAYVGVSGMGVGQGMMGHVFLVIAEEPGQILTATVYQYGIQLPPGENFGVGTVLQLSTFPFVVEKGPAWRFIKNYNKENRVVLLFELNLDENQVAQVEAKVTEDKKSRDELPQRDYVVDSSNCATKVYDLINQVVPEALQFHYVSPLKSFYKFEVFHPRQMSMAIPISAAPELEHHPLVKNTIRFRQQALADLEIAVAAFDNLKPLFTACRTSSAAQDVLAEMYGNQALRQSETYLKMFSGFFSSCVKENQKLKDVFNEHVDFLRMGVDDKAFLERSNTFYLQ